MTVRSERWCRSGSLGRRRRETGLCLHRTRRRSAAPIGPLGSASTDVDGGPEWPRLYPNAWCRASARRRPAAAARPRGRMSRSSRAADIGEHTASNAIGHAALAPAARRSGAAARTSGEAVTKIFTSASGQMTVPMSRPSSTAPARRAAKPRWKSSSAARTSGMAATMRGRLADRAACAGRARRARPDRARWPRERRRRRRPDRSPRVEHVAARPRGRAGRCRDGAGRNARRARLASVPLPEAAGPSMAMIMRTLRACAERSSVSATKPGKLVAIMAVSSTVHRAARRQARASAQAPWRCGGRGGSSTAPPPGTPAVALPLTGQIVALDRRLDAVARAARRRSRRGGRSP